MLTWLLCSVPPQCRFTLPTSSSQGILCLRHVCPRLYYSHKWQALSRVTPASGPAEAAGTAVTFYGHGFVNTTKLACRFALAPPVPATFISPNELSCETPPLVSAVGSTMDGEDHGLMWSALSEIWQEVADPLTGSRQLFPEAHYFPLFLQRAVGVEVSVSTGCERRS